MVIVQGATGYIGRTFAEELRRRRTRSVPLRRRALDYTRFEVLFEYLRQAWDLVDQARSGLLNGSFLLLSHYADATFENVIVTPIGGQ